MRTLKFAKIWIPAFLLAAVMAGCGDSDKNAGAGNPGAPLTAPTVTSETPVNGSPAVCPNTAIISATFSKPMNPATINNTTFTLTGPSGNVPGSVTYNAGAQVATFTPNPPGLGTTGAQFTATITTGAQDLFGNGLATNFVWMFTTSAPCPPPMGTGLGAACGYGILAGTTVTSTGATHVSGDVGVSPGTAVVGFADSNTFAVGTGGTHTAGPGIATGIIHLNDPPPPSVTSAAAAQSALTTSYNDLAGRTMPAPATVAGDLVGQTLAPGIYKSTSSLAISGTLTLSGNANAVWIFQIGSSLTTASNSSVVLAGGANANNIFWQVGSSATLGTNSTFNGSILALTSITVTNGATLNGRALARNGAVTLDTNMVNVTCP